MASTVITRPNHYELLGLTPSATAAEIKAAFAREIGRPRAFGGLLDVGAAYEALRDPVKRRAYDEAHGFTRPKAPPPRIERFSMALPAIHVGPAAAAPEPIPDPQAVAEPKIASFIAASVRTPAKHAPRHDSAPMAVPAYPSVEPLPQVDADGPTIDLKRPAVLIGGLVAGVALIGAWAGVTAGNEAETAAPQRAVTVPLPKAKALAPAAIPADNATRLAARQLPVRSLAERPVKHAAETVPPQALATLATETLAEAPVAPAADPLAPAPVEAALPDAAAMPLSNTTIARTIGRIGYSCGTVSATEPLGGGSFKIICSSGQSYRAAPVHGRYRFKRL
jgi:hypothetical protein